MGMSMDSILAAASAAMHNFGNVTNSGIQSNLGWVSTGVESPRGAVTTERRRAFMAVAVREIDDVSLPPAGKYELDVTHTQVEFVARHMLTKMRGRFVEFEGTIVVGEGPEDSSVEVEIKTDSVQTNQEQRDEHLKSADFFEVENHPVMTFRSTAVRHTGGNKFELDGDLTIKDTTKPITLTGEFLGWGKDPYDNTILSASAKTEISREDWDLTWNMAVETGGFLVGKKVGLEIEVEARKVG
jgi:polyisoprenoid-binding protein YceI